ncbi:ThuA domain-containing protein [Herbiconiux moechotypicola]|uniref:ThuA domain-containing protein n=1 Tax=Herbiconiux moechotypicola TaxID=637393 RepID=A0ABN3DNY0_9MICO|nr:ThuA domain-containing protein [Herbiconiux moechotypicola]MCS5730437.1 ThuA domain-containing protein [Herbiconiux moechotypicola]
MRTIVVISGEAGHDDPWHALAGTSARVAEVLSAGEGLTASVVGTAQLEERGSEVLGEADVLVLNVSGDLGVEPGVSGPLVDLLEAHVASGRGIVALHSSALAFRDDPRWAELLGGRWVPGRSGHPQIGRALVQPTEAGRAALPGLGDFVLYDERYTALETGASTSVLAEHTDDGFAHPLVWVVEFPEGRGRVAYDALGHGVESYDSGEHRALLRGLVEWAAASRETVPAAR